jgi:hypothetical protein
LRKAKHFEEPRSVDENSFLQTVVIQRTLPFEFHAADTHANPLIRAKNAILFLTADSTNFPDKVAGKATHEASTDAATWRCPVTTWQPANQSLSQPLAE